MAFKTKFELYEWLVMPFGLTNSLSTFTRLMNHVLRSLITNVTETLFFNLGKCIFSTHDITFLVFVVGCHGVKVDEEKVKVIQDWPIPKTMGEVRSFHGLAIFYRRFVKDFSTLPAHLNEIVKRNVGFKWEENQERAFQALKERLT
ncbi:Retrovirus-related Pol polyprotein from transposon 17.6, partial [Mucuna pruriens]